MNKITTVFAVFIGGAIGATLRYNLTLLFNSPMPYGTLAANITGAFLIALYYEFIMNRETISQPLKAFIATGCIGSLTTFSTFSLELYQFLLNGHYWIAIIYGLGSVFLGILSATIGVVAAKLIWKDRRG
jgi:CrcB protein